MSKPKLPELRSDKEADTFVDEADLSEYDLSGAQRHRFAFAPEAFHFEIFRDTNEKFRARFTRGGEIIFTTEAYPSEALAKQAIETIKRNGPNAGVRSDAGRDAA